MSALRHVAAAVAVATACASAGCATHGLGLQQDHRVEVLGPKEGGHASVPFVLRWRVKDQNLAARLASGAATFAVFFDRSPMPSGATVHAVGDKICKRTPGCPDADWLTSRDIYLTDDSQLRVDRLTDRRDGHHHTDDHDATIVVLGRDGRRIGESAFRAEFIIDRDES